MKNNKKRNLIILFFTFVICFILIAKFISADDQLYIGCGGDNQTMFGCMGDNQTFTTATEVALQNASVPMGNGTTIINVTNVTTITTVVQGGGGGGGAITYVPTTTTPTFSLSTNNLSAFLKQGQVVTQTLTITNNGAQAATISISNQMGNLVQLSDTSVTINPGQSQTITINFVASNTTTPNLYLGSILFTSNGASIPVFVALEIESSNPLLDVAINLPNTQFSPGDTMLAGITLYNLGSTFGDVSVNYIMEDESGNVILNQSDTVAIQTQTSYIKSLLIPSNAALGHYILYVRANYIGKIASASTGFDLVSISNKEKIYIIIIIGLVVIIAAFIGFIILRRVKKRYKQIKRVGLEDLLWR
jgi:uncharacterized membrane protein